MGELDRVAVVAGLGALDRLARLAAVDRLRRLGALDRVGRLGGVGVLGRSAASFGSALSAASLGLAMSAGERGAVLGERGHPEALWLTAGILVTVAAALAWEALRELAVFASLAGREHE